MAAYKKKQGVMYGHPNARRMRKHLRQKIHHQRSHHQPCIEEYIDDFSDYNDVDDYGIDAGIVDVDPSGIVIDDSYDDA